MHNLIGFGNFSNILQIKIGMYNAINNELIQHINTSVIF